MLVCQVGPLFALAAGPAHVSDVSIHPARLGDVGGIQRVAEDAWNTVYSSVLQHDTIDAALHEWCAQDLVRQQVAAEDIVFIVADDARQSWATRRVD